ncbi:lycopene cyclase domain-containing protein [Sediminitomix flava]|uniref:Lycopene cyclase domain-containing protein n=1 Tax=Sediminitomix flava TaxID=379075 RepID=A0A315Z712_SEDFL|nr:lycopene cyclase domain-containing protein [Sediminitomix flava]PWJ38461.1 lycopene cyclase domain-containing protein [Sediminitomix flava]
MEMIPETYYYLLVDFGVIFFPILLSFGPYYFFYKNWKQAFWAILIPAIFFIVWDEAFTQMGVWGFNPRYLTGIYAGHLPLEEILFFIIIPYACVFTYGCYTYWVPKDYFRKIQKHISNLLIIGLVISTFLFWGKWYTNVTFILLSITIFYLEHIRKVTFLSKFYPVYILILPFFLLSNGVLTGSFLDEPIVWYNPMEIIGVRIFTIPMEDSFYGMLLLMLNIFIFDLLVKRKEEKGTSRVETALKKSI